MKKIPLNFMRKRNSFPFIKNDLVLDNRIFNNPINYPHEMPNIGHLKNREMTQFPSKIYYFQKFHTQDLRSNLYSNEYVNHFRPVSKRKNPKQIMPLAKPNIFEMVTPKHQFNGFKLIEPEIHKMEKKIDLKKNVQAKSINPFKNNMIKTSENEFKAHQEIIKKRSCNELSLPSIYPIESSKKKFNSFPKTHFQGNSLTSNCSPKPFKLNQNKNGIFFSSKKHVIQNSTNESNNQYSKQIFQKDSNYLANINSLEKIEKKMECEDEKILKILRSELTDITQLKVSNIEFRKKMNIFVSKWNHILANNSNNLRYPSIDFL
jgi:hypothetical protein